jgi:hypothetical protein
MSRTKNKAPGRGNPKKDAARIEASTGKVKKPKKPKKTKKAKTGEIGEVKKSK